jgi:class 3 adenylate cyclase/tetratricopeptide (TPR) repeat protein
MPDLDENALFKRLRPYLPPHLEDRLSDDITADDARTILIHITSQRHTLSTYLPRYLVKLVTDDPTPGQVDSSFRHGAVMLADVSGFTAMSEKLSVLGKEGAEEITGIVNDYFDTMLDISAKYGGDLLKFGGDALLIFFEGRDGPRRAIATAHAMQHAMDRFAQLETSRGVFTLQMSIGIGCGPIFLAHLGSAENVEYTVMGRGLANTAKAEDKAIAGQIIVDQATRDAVQEIATFASAGDDFWLLKTLSLDNADDLLNQCLPELIVIEALRPFVSAELLAHLIVDPRRRKLPGSHRPVTVLFANFYGIDGIIEALGPEHEAAITEILNIHFNAMSRILTRHGGLINKVDTYAVGHRIVALFGALRAHEDDPQRAVHAALEMNRALKAVNRRTQEVLAAIPDLDVDFSAAVLKQRIGLNSGFVFAGNVGSAARREYSVMGDEVNLAARLMSVAQEGEVLVSQGTARQLGDRFTLIEKSPLKVKGKARPARTFVVTGERERPSPWASVAMGPMVGRDEELKIGQAAVDRACAGDGCLLVISGVSGIGKTRLVEELVLYGQSVGMDLLAGTCLSYGQTMLYHPWADILRVFFGIRPGDDANTHVEAVQRGLDLLGEGVWAPIFGDVLGLDIPENDLTGALDAKLRRQRLLDLTLKSLQTSASSRPLMLVVEDAHWADPASMGLVNYVARNITEHPILFILSYRLDKVPPDWGAGVHAVSLPLSDLSDEACLRIVQGMIGKQKLPGSLRDLILGKGAGNPFFIEEVMHALIDAGALRKEPSGTWQVDHTIETIALPDTIHGIILSRIDRLPQTDRRVLQIASVIGRVFSRHLLESAYPYADVSAALHQSLDYLVGLGLIEPQSPKDGLYRFRHLTTWDVVYESMAFEQRRGLHRRVAHFIEHEFAETLAEQAGLLAYHYWEGHDWAKAMEYNLLTARHAQREFANDTAVAAYRRALEAGAKADMDTSPTWLAAHESLGEVLTLLGRYEEALEHYATAQAMVDVEPLSVHQKRHLADLCRKTAEVHERRSEYDIAFKWLTKALGYLDAPRPTIEMARIYLLGAGIYRRQGKNSEAVDWCLKSEKTALGLKTREGQQTVAQVYYNLGGIYTHRGDLRQALWFCQQSVTAYQEIDDIVGLSQAFINLANAYSDQGDWDRASVALGQSLAIKQEIGDIFHQGFILNNLANIHLYRGEWTQAAGLYGKSNAIWKRVGAVMPEAVTLSNLAQVHIYEQNWSGASDCLSRSQALFAEIGSEDFLAELERRWGEFYLRTGELDQALAHSRRSIRLAVSQSARLEEGISYRVLGQVHLARGETERAKDALRQSLGILNDLESQYEAARTMLCLVRLALEGEPTVAARTQLAQAVKIFENLGAQADLAEARNLAKQLSSPGG